MSEVAFGIHAVNSLLRRSPDRILSLSIQVDRNDKRIQELVSLAQNQGIALARVPKAELDELTTERHQGVVAVIERIETIGRDGDSCGGVIECVVRRPAMGLGMPVFDKLEALFQSKSEEILFEYDRLINDYTVHKLSNLLWHHERQRNPTDIIY